MEWIKLGQAVSMKKIVNDNLAIVSTAIFFIIFFFGSDYLELSSWLKYVLCGIAGVVGFFAVSFFEKLPKRIKVAAFLLLVVLIIIAIIYQYHFKTRYKEETLYGSWVTDDSDDFIIKFKITADKLFISRSSDQAEKMYVYSLSNDSLKVFNGNEKVFSWKLIMPDKNKIILNDGEENLSLTREYY